MSKILPRILMLFCGGSIAMRVDQESGSLRPHDTADSLLALEPRISNLCQVEIEHLTDIDSTDMGRSHWQSMIEIIADRYKDFDGFLITIGTNTLAYASSALSFALPDIGKPVVLTGAQVPSSSIATDARNNIVNAIRVATMDLAGVYVVFGSKVIRGCRAKKETESGLDAFATFNADDIGEIGVDIFIRPEAERRHDRPLKPRNGFADEIVSMTLLPGLSPRFLIRLIDDGVKGVVLRGFGSGDLPQALLPALRYARDHEVPVVVTTQCPRGATVMGLNENGRLALETGVIQAFDMSMETMSTKLMWLLARPTPFSEIKTQMHEDLLGEITDSRSKRILGEFHDRMPGDNSGDRSSLCKE
jgi:L-asparaginase